MRVLSLLAASLLAITLSAAPVQAGVDNPATTAELVAAVKDAYTGISSVRADFVQIVRNPTMGTADRQKGKISIEKPRKLRVEVGAPMESMVVSDGKTLWVYSVTSKSVLETPEATQANEIGALLDDLTHLSDVFEVTMIDERPANPKHVVKLVPHKAGNFKSIQLTLSKPKYTLQQLLLEDQLGNITEMDFVNLRLNQDVPDSEFTFVPPAGVQVIKTTGL